MLTAIKNAVNLSGPELIRAQVRTSINTHNILDLIYSGRSLIVYDRGCKECDIIRDNMDEIENIPGIRVTDTYDYVFLSFDEDASIDTWEPYMIDRFEDCISHYLISNGGRLYIRTDTPLEQSFVDYMVSEGFEYCSKEHILTIE